MWLTAPEFMDQKPIDILHREMDDAANIQENEALYNRHMLVRCDFDAEGDAVLDITADDYYKAYLDGRLIGMGPAQGYHDCYPFNRYPLKLTPGRHRLAVHVFYMGTLCRAYQSCDNRQGLWFEVRDGAGKVAAQSGGRCRVCCPTGWSQCGLSGYKTQFVEEVYGNQIPENWKTTDDLSAWQEPIVNQRDDHVLQSQPAPPVETEIRMPVMRRNAGQSAVYDMGEEMVGIPVVIAAQADEHTLVTVRLGEELTTDGHVMCPTRANCDTRYLWHPGKSGTESDFFDYTAFRYMEVTCEGGSVENARVLARHAKMADTVGTFHSESRFADDIFRICRNGVKWGTQEAYLDCPGREKGQYLGDGTVTAHAQLLLTGDKTMYRKMLYDFARSTRICPGMMAVAPGGLMQEIADYSCQYPGQLLTYLDWTGDEATVRELMPVSENVENWFDSYRNDDGLIEGVTGKWNLVDWPKNLRDDYDFPLTKPIGPGVHNVMNAFYYGLKRDNDRLRERLGLPQRHEAEQVKEAFERTFLLPNGLYRDAPQTTHTALHSVVLPLYYGMTAKENVSAALAFIRKKGMACGVYMAYFVLKAAAQAGDYALMNELMFSTGIHSWGNMLAEGATTCWEAWGREQKWNTSLCHPWASAPVSVMIEDMIGLQPVQSRQAAITPHVPDFIGDFQLVVGTRFGPLEITREKGKLDYRFPQN